ncbi:guanine-1-methyltransferase-domain-containing protein [Massariosphaeria phaeospora]|uniref:tRNA (guanine(9)-N1)-methyltransferase n=1 Tax=Massariosphaeria phaeospora TaxID=100035 RepID=A0A7C8I2G4_9PLEO|nr:guanine-1-methyltransferase-domain-containing protein [Massariosphaeria phaeospora]
MDSEERPAKMRKLDHTLENMDTEIAESAPADGASDPPDTTLVDELPHAEMSNDDENHDKLPGDAGPKISKNQLKKQRRLERWEAGREDRKVVRKEKIKAKKERIREARAQPYAEGEENSGEAIKRRRPGILGTQVPITVIFDCDFNDLMFDTEMKSMGLQITRCYSDNRKAPFRAHLALSSFGGKMQERFDGILAKQYTSWKGFQFFSEDFVHVAEQSKEWMRGKDGGDIAGALKQNDDSTEDTEEEGEVVYLSSDSDVTLERLKPNSTYIIGGLVDRNRHKGICYRRAKSRGIKTAKLPIGQYLDMKSRQILATNHVLEIMLKWLELGDWGKAFMEVIPRRKGGVLRSELEEGGKEGEQGEGEQQDEQEEGGQRDEQEEDTADNSGPHIHFKEGDNSAEGGTAKDLQSYAEDEASTPSAAVEPRLPE